MKLTDEHITFLIKHKPFESWNNLYREFRKYFKLKVGDATIRRAYYRGLDSTPAAPARTRNHFVISDVQAKPGLTYPHLHAAGKLIVERRPDVVINIGDFGDFPSLSSYDKGTASAEGRRVKDDLYAMFEASDILLAPLKRLQIKQAERGEPIYKPRLIWTLGNHEHRVWRYESINPELQGVISTEILGHKDWEVHPFLAPVVVDGVTYIHYMPNPMTGKPYSGTPENMLQKVGFTFVQGHSQKWAHARKDLTNGKVIHCLVSGSYYQHNEEYKGEGGNLHWRGCAYLHDVRDGDFDIESIHIDRLMGEYL